MNPRRQVPLEPTPLARLLRARREALGYSRPDVERRTGITESALDSYEHGVSPRVSTAIHLARFYGIPLEELADAVGAPAMPTVEDVTPARAVTSARLARRWTVEEMAGALGVTAQEVAAWERGDLEPSASALARVMMLPPAPGALLEE